MIGIAIGNYIGNQRVKYWTPRNIVLTLITGGIRITYTPAANSETEIYVSIDSGAYTLVTTTGLTIGTYDYMVTEGHTYSFQLRSKKDTTVLNIPTNLVVSDLGGGTVRVTWDDNNTEADHIEIWADIEGAGSALITTVEDGVETYDHAVGGSKNIVYKIRAKEGTLPVYSGYTATQEVDTAAVPDYANPGGTGDRSALITVTTDVEIGAGVIGTLVNGNTLENTLYWKSPPNAVAGKYLKFDFGAGASKVISEAKWYQKDESGHNIQGNWKWQGSDNDVDWSDIGGNFEWGTTATQVLNSLSANTTGYRYYRMLGVSGNVTDFPYLREMEFKIADA